jgi:hypothetical protein
VSDPKPEPCADATMHGPVPRDRFDVEADVLRYAEEAKRAHQERDRAICEMRRLGAYLYEIAGAADMARSNVSKILRRHGLR